MLDETNMDLDQYPNANIAEYGLTSGTENSVKCQATSTEQESMHCTNDIKSVNVATTSKTTSITITGTIDPES